MRRSFALLALVALSLSAVVLAADLEMELMEAGMDEVAPADSRFSMKPVIDATLLESSAEHQQEQFPNLDAGKLLERTKQFGADVVKAFDAWRLKFAKKYQLGEAMQRLSVFAANLKRIAKLNAQSSKGEYTADGPFADMTEEEFRATMLRARPPPIDSVPPSIFLEQEMQREGDVLFEMSAETQAELESEIIDYRSQSTPIKNQGQCGSCWAFSAVTTFEYAVAKAGKGITPLSVQHLMDCDTAKGQKACDGGDPLGAFKFYNKQGSIAESAYTKYSAKKGVCTVASGPGPKAKNFGLAIPQCKVGACANQVKLEPTIIRALKMHGPVSILLNANSLQFWKKGILEPNPDPKTGCKADWDSLNHAMVIVGYNAAEKTWLIRNSWGAKWGEAGYFRLQYGTNACGVADFAVVVEV